MDCLSNGLRSFQRTLTDDVDIGLCVDRIAIGIAVFVVACDGVACARRGFESVEILVSFALVNVVGILSTAEGFVFFPLSIVGRESLFSRRSSCVGDVAGVVKRNVHGVAFLNGDCIVIEGVDVRVACRAAVQGDDCVCDTANSSVLAVGGNLQCYKRTGIVFGINSACLSLDNDVVGLHCSNAFRIAILPESGIAVIIFFNVDSVAHIEVADNVNAVRTRAICAGNGVGRNLESATARVVVVNGNLCAVNGVLGSVVFSDSFSVESAIRAGDGVLLAVIRDNPSFFLCIIIRIEFKRSCVGRERIFIRRGIAFNVDFVGTG